MRVIEGEFTQRARLDLVVGPSQGRVVFQVWAEYVPQDEKEARRKILHVSVSPEEARRLAICIRELADGNIGDFREAGLGFEADEWGYSIYTPSERGVWFEEEITLRELADKLEKAAEGCE